MAELKPCPFCGRKPRIESCENFGYFVICKCGIEQSTLYAQKCDAVKRWNRRRNEPNAEKAVDCDNSNDNEWSENR